METLTGLMDCDYSGDDQSAEAAVRDGDPSIDILLLRQGGHGHIMLTDEKSELRLPLDAEGIAQLNGWQLSYDQSTGLKCVKEASNESSSV